MDGVEKFRGVDIRIDDGCKMTVEAVCSSPLELSCTDTTASIIASNAPINSGVGASAICYQANRGVESRQWTTGYGGSLDVLSDVKITVYFDWNCEDGVAQLHSYSGTCSYGSWNGWQNPSCTYQTDGDATSTGTEMGLNGQFQCYNIEFCWSNHYVYSLYADVTGKNDGTAFCGWSYTGNLPPDGTTSHLHNTCYWV